MNDPTKERAKDLDTSPNKVTQIVNEHMKRCSSQDIREPQINMQYHYTTIRIMKTPKHGQQMLVRMWNRHSLLLLMTMQNGTAFLVTL